MARISISNYEFTDEIARYAVDTVDAFIDDTLMLRVHSLFERYCEPYVPFLTGALSQTTEVTPEYVKYKVPYAHRQYVGEDFNHTLTYHPLASAYWDRVMLSTQGDEFLEQVKELIRQRAGELYG